LCVCVVCVLCVCVVCVCCVCVVCVCCVCVLCVCVVCVCCVCVVCVCCVCVLCLCCVCVLCVVCVCCVWVRVLCQGLGFVDLTEQHQRVGSGDLSIFQPHHKGKQLLHCLEEIKVAAESQKIPQEGQKPKTPCWLQPPWPLDPPSPSIIFSFSCLQSNFLSLSSLTALPSATCQAQNSIINH